MKYDLASMTHAELVELCKTMGERPFRAKQLFGWIQGRGVGTIGEMTDLPKAFRAKLEENATLTTLSMRRRRASKLDGTIKYLFELPDGETIETVRMVYHHGVSLCLSTQVGCRMGCAFCASGIGGLCRHLTAGEILGQIRAVMADTGERPDSLVLMGIGEPLDNYDNVMRFLSLLSDPDGFGMSHRHLSLSTCGIVPRIYDLADKRLQLTLSISLHAPNDEIRGKIMPVNHRWGVDELLEACRYYAEKTRRRISFEYAVIEGVNDSKACAEELAHKLRGMLCHINLIPLNRIEERAFVSGRESAERFQRALGEGLSVTIRRTLGSDIEAACGQLRRAEASAGQTNR